MADICVSSFSTTPNQKSYLWALSRLSFSASSSSHFSSIKAKLSRCNASYFSSHSLSCKRDKQNNFTTLENKLDRFIFFNVLQKLTCDSPENNFTILDNRLDYFLFIIHNLKTYWQFGVFQKMKQFCNLCKHFSIFLLWVLQTRHKRP